MDVDQKTISLPKATHYVPIGQRRTRSQWRQQQEQQQEQQEQQQQQQKQQKQQKQQQQQDDRSVKVDKQETDLKQDDVSEQESGRDDGQESKSDQEHKTEQKAKEELAEKPRPKSEVESLGSRLSPYVWVLLFVLGVVSAIWYRYVVLQPPPPILDDSLICQIDFSDLDCQRVYEGLSECPFARQDLLLEHLRDLPGYDGMARIRQANSGFNHANMRRLHRGLHSADRRLVLDVTDRMLTQFRQVKLVTDTVARDVTHWTQQVDASAGRYQEAHDAATKAVFKYMMVKWTPSKRTPAEVEALATRESRKTCLLAYERASANTTVWQKKLVATSQKMDSVVSYFERRRDLVVWEVGSPALAVWNKTLLEDVRLLLNDTKLFKKDMQQWVSEL